MKKVFYFLSFLLFFNALQAQEKVFDFKESKLIVTVEEHNIIGGLGSAIAEHKASIKNSPEMLILGIKDAYGKSGSYNFLKEKHRLTPSLIVQDILKIFH